MQQEPKSIRPQILAWYKTNAEQLWTILVGVAGFILLVVTIYVLTIA